MTWLDVLIVVFAALTAFAGYRRGVFASAFSLIGLVAGAIAGAHLAPLLLARGAHSPYAPAFALGGGLLLGLLCSTPLEVLGLRVHARLGPRLGMADGVGGAVLMAAFALGATWLVGTAVVHAAAPGALRHDVRESHIFQRLSSILPASGAVIDELARLDPLPQISGPQPSVRPPTAAIARNPNVAAAANRVVRITGTACGQGIEGSGWIAGDGEVVTAAHVVAGESNPTVQLGGRGPAYDAQAIWFDPRNDVAVLRVPELSGLSPLRLDQGVSEGAPAAILGFPEDGPYSVEPGRVAATSTTLTQNAYGRGPVSRLILAFRGLVRPGNSGGPLVDGGGRVVGTVFASSESGPRSGYAVPDSIVARALARAGGSAGTGHCVS